jgi:diacylglycerol kinase family enzyme
MRTGCGLLFQNGKPIAGARHFRCAEFELTSTPGAPLELEGDAVGALPAKFSIAPQKLRVIVP